MNYLGIDYGEKRIGLAFGDELGIAMPLRAAVHPSREARMEHIAKVVAQKRIGTLVVGYPYNFDGTVGFKAREVDAFIAELERSHGLPVVRVDETLTSVEAAGTTKKGRHNLEREKRHRASGEIDSRAAAIILQDYLDQNQPPADAGQ